jgi:hypothetical protein
MPFVFPAHQGLILPVARKWPGRFDVLALSIGAAMPDISDSVLGFLVNGYFKQWHGHSLMGIIAFDIPGGLLLTWMVTVLAARLLKTNTSHGWQTRLRLWSFSITIGVLSHLGFDLISHTTNLLLYPWWSNVQWFPRWWYATWFEFHPLSIFDPSYTAGPHTVVWCVLSLIGSLYFCRSLNPKKAGYR